MATLPQYVSDRGHGEICFEVPLAIRDVTSYMFVLGCERSALQSFVDEQLNAAPGGAVEYTALPFVLHAYFKAMHCTSLGEVVGFLSDHESAFLVPLLQKRRGQLIPELRFWVPYLFIDQESGMVTGREVWGYRKTMGTITVPEVTSANPRFAAETMVFDTFATTTLGHRARIVEVRGTLPLGPLASTWASFEEAFGEVFNRIGKALVGALLALPGAILQRFLVGAKFPVVNLKQFRDARDSSKACYQALIDCPNQLDKWSGGGILAGSFELEVKTCASHTIVKDLGLGTPGAESTVRPIAFGYWVKMDFQTLPGDVLWQAP